MTISITRPILAHGSNPAHGDTTRKAGMTQSAEAAYASFGAP
jgi:hypothetical protein